jgi:hypothetical protein
MQKNINSYNYLTFRPEFEKTEIYKQLDKEWDILIFDDQFGIVNRKGFPNTTHREQLASRKFTLAPFYYLNILCEQNPREIYDLGCGWNIFKKYIPNIIGVGEEPADGPGFHGDIWGRVDDEYVATHQNYFESVFSINALHFHPLSNLRKIATDFVSMIKPDGYGFLAINLARMLERDTDRFGLYSNADLENYVRTELYNIPGVDYKVFDVNLHQVNALNDGNIKFVCHKIT